MDKKTAICRYLSRHHRGKAKAVFSRELERLFSIDGRNLRRKIHSLRKDGYPICSDESGYYYAETQQEINDTIFRLNELVTKVSNARTGLLYSSVLEPSEVIVEVNLNLISEEG